MKTTENTKRTEKESLAQLVARAKAGDQAAFSELYDRTSADLYRSIRAMTRDEDLSWDIQQDSYLRAFQSLDKLENDEAFLPWLRRIAANVTATKMSKRLPVTFTDLTGDDEDDAIPELPDLNAENQPELSLDRKETSRLVKEILSQLPEGQQMILGMRYYDELSVKEIAALLKISDGTVKAALFQGRKKVESAVRALEKQGVKLYGLSPVAFLLALMKQQAVPAQRSEAVLASTLSKAGIAAGAKAAAPAVLQATKPFFSTTLGKVVLGVAAAAVVVGGAAGYRWARNNLFEKTAPILMVDSSEDLQNDPTAPTIPVEVDVTGPTVPVERDDTAEDLVTEPVVSEPVVSEPAVTEPTVTEPSATEPAETEPVGTDPAVTEPSGAEPAQPVRADNQCGEHLTWRFEFGYEYGNLIFEGSGPMDDYADPQDAPWYSHRSEITGIDLPNGLTAIGDNAFAGCTALHYYVRLPDTLTSIGRSAFQGCTSMEGLSFRTSLTEIGENAFSGCTALSWCPLPDSLTSLGSGAFTGCDSLQTLQIFNPACVIGSGALVSPQTKLVGFPGSTAEQNAAKNGYDFEAISEVDESMLRDLLNQSKLLSITEESYVAENGQVVEYSAYDKYHPVVFSGGMYRIGDRCLMKLIYSPFLTVPAAEMEQMLAQARQTGTLDLNGETWIYTESADQVKELVDDAFYPESDHGWIVLESGEAAYAIQPIGDTYVFRYSFFGLSGYMRSNSSKELGWLWLDTDTPVTQWRETTSPATLGNWFAYTWAEEPRDDYWSLELGDDGNYVANTNTAGKK